MLTCCPSPSGGAIWAAIAHLWGSIFGPDSAWGRQEAVEGDLGCLALGTCSTSFSRCCSSICTQPGNKNLCIPTAVVSTWNLPSPPFLSLGYAALPWRGCSPPALRLLVFAVPAPNSLFALQWWLLVSPAWFLSSLMLW